MKPTILSRYLLKEVFATAAVITVILLLVFLSHQMVRLLSYAASGKLAANILLQLIGFEIPYLLAFLLPLGLFLGIIWAYSGMYVNNELRVMHACGFSLKRLFKLTSVLAVLVALMVSLLMLWVNPWIAKAKDQIIAHGKAAENIIDTILPGRFQVSHDGKRVVYVERLSRDHQQAHNVFIADQRSESNEEVEHNRWNIVSAASGYQAKEGSNQDRFLVAEWGNRYEGAPGQSDYKVIQFKKYSVRLPEVQLHSKHQEQEAFSTFGLFHLYDNVNSAAELQWRLSLPLSVLLLALLAIPLSQVKPRYGRYLQLLTGILIYVVYVNLLFVARNWIEQRMVPIGLGMWWVHLALLCVLLLVMAKQWGNFFRRQA
jgi:lipopolysaccharide export system permease protein